MIQRTLLTFIALSSTLAFSLDGEVGEVAIAQPKVVANGFNTTKFLLRASDELAGETLSYNVLQGEATLNGIKYDSQLKGFVGTISPSFKEEKLLVEFNIHGEKIEDKLEVEFTHDFIKEESTSGTKITYSSFPFDKVTYYVDESNGIKSVEKFEVKNQGDGFIAKSEWSRSYNFYTGDQARQTTYLGVENYNEHGNISDMWMRSSLYLFPRKTLPRVSEASDDRLEVVLPTDEHIFFDKKTGTISGENSVIEEGPIDMSDNRFTRTFADVRYVGKGVVMRVNARGRDPEEGSYGSAPISGEFGHKGEGTIMIYRFDPKSKKTLKCFTKREKVFEKDTQKLIFTSDEAFNQFLKDNKCPFSMDDLL